MVNNLSKPHFLCHKILLIISCKKHLWYVSISIYSSFSSALNNALDNNDFDLDNGVNITAGTDVTISADGIIRVLGSTSNTKWGYIGLDVNGLTVNALQSCNANQDMNVVFTHKLRKGDIVHVKLANDGVLNNAKFFPYK